MHPLITLSTSGNQHHCPRLSHNWPLAILHCSPVSESIVTLSQFDLHSILKLQFRGTHLNLFISYWTLTHNAKWPSNTHWIFAHSLVNVQQPTSIQMGTIIMSTPFASKLSLWYLLNNNANWKSHRVMVSGRITRFTKIVLGRLWKANN